MNEECEEMLIGSIKLEIRIEEPAAEINKLLEEYGMGDYSRVCGNRIERAGLVDDVHVMKTYGPEQGIHVDAEGLKAVMPILKGYIEPDILDELETGLQEYSGIVSSLNNILYILRRQSRKELRQMYREAVREDGIDRDIYILELKQRSIWNRIRRFLQYSKDVCRAAIDIRMPVIAIPAYLKEAFPMSKLTAYDPGYAGGPYYQALMRFKKRHGRHEGLKHDDLIKYVYLGVKAFGGEYVRLKREAKIKSLENVEWTYKRCQDLMEAIGNLAPAQLIQLFPVTKDFTGDKYDWKDYFWTMKRLEKFPQDKPIGSEQDAADILWDYVNHDTEFFFLTWMNCVDDMSTYCGDDEPREKFYGRRIKEHEADAEGA